MLIFDAVSLGGAVLGSALIAANIGKARIGYILFLLSAAASCVLLLESDASRSLLLTNLWFIAMNVIGIVRHK